MDAAEEGRAKAAGLPGAGMVAGLDLAIRQSRFQTNETLRYVPLSRPVSERYQLTFLHRLLWESAHDLSHDAVETAEP